MVASSRSFTGLHCLSVPYTAKKNLAKSIDLVKLWAMKIGL